MSSGYLALSAVKKLRTLLSPDYNLQYLGNFRHRHHKQITVETIKVISFNFSSALLAGFP